MAERGDRSILPLSGERQAARTTIVGGQPPGQGRTLATIPNGLEHLLGMAAADAAFAQALLADRQQVLTSSGIELTGAEQAMLQAVDGAALTQMIATVGTKLEDKDRRAFLALATAALAGLGGLGLACSGKSTPREKPIPAAGQPVRLPPKALAPKQVPQQRAVETGARPDRPDPLEDEVIKPAKPPASKPTKPPGVKGGVRPDRPKPSARGEGGTER